jgi:hypothetical protein
MRKSIKKALIAYFTKDADGHRRCRKAPFGITVSDAALRFSIYLTLTYKAGSRYCCTAPACAFFPDWEDLKQRLREEEVEAAYPLRIYLRCVYERGARIAAVPSDAGTDYQPIEQGWESYHVVDEVDGWDPVELWTYRPRNEDNRRRGGMP